MGPSILASQYPQLKHVTDLKACQAQEIKNVKPTSTPHIFIHSFSSLLTGPKPLPQRALHIVRSRASSFK